VGIIFTHLIVTMAKPQYFIFDSVCFSGFFMNNFKVWRACNLTAFIHSSTGSVVYPFASCHEGPRFIPQGGGGYLQYVKPGFSC
jgi:hypothetical protein